MLQAEEWSTVLHGFCCIPHARRQRADGPLSLPPELFGISEQLRIPYKLEVTTIDEQKQAPEIGTPEAAVQSCVNLLAKVTNIPESKLAYYLDMYYQLRDAYEAARAEERLEAQQNEETLLQVLHLPPIYPDPPRTMNTPTTPAEVTDDLPPCRDAIPVPAAQRPDNGAAAELTEPLDPPQAAGLCETPDAFSGFEPVEIKASGPAAQAAAEKRRIKERLDKLRTAGVSVRRIVKAANGNITEDQIREIIDCKKMPIAVYRVLDGALDTLEGPGVQTSP